MTPGTFEEYLAAFGGMLREDYGFTVGPGETVDALRALESVGVHDRERVRTALALVYCASHDDLAQFNAAFDAFFSGAIGGVTQARYAPRHTLPNAASRRERHGPNQLRRANREASAPVHPSGAPSRSLRRSDADASDALAVPACASTIASAGESAIVDAAQAEELLAAAGQLLRRLRLGRSRRWHAAPQGSRLDFRRTLRSSLQTAGEPFFLHRLGHPPRNPRIVVAIDGSRSMDAHRDAMLRFAWALVQRSRRVEVFVFSTALHDVTRALRETPVEGVLDLGHLSDAWGSGTRIGDSLLSLVRKFGHRVLGRDTVTIVFSDGLDVGDPATVAQAMRELRRRGAAVVWLNPFADSPGYEPTASGMRAALPYLTSLQAAPDEAALVRFARLARIS